MALAVVDFNASTSVGCCCRCLLVTMHGDVAACHQYRVACALRAQTNFNKLTSLVFKSITWVLLSKIALRAPMTGTTGVLAAALFLTWGPSAPPGLRHSSFRM